jgi:cell division protein FtsL
MRERTRYLRRPRRTRWQRWAEGIDPWHPRPGDFVVFALAFLVLALAYVGERTYALHLNRRMFLLEERLASRREANAVLAARVNMLADRGRITTLAQRDLGMVVPNSESFRYIYFVPSAASPVPARRRADPRVLAGIVPPVTGARGR